MKKTFLALASLLCLSLGTIKAQVATTSQTQDNDATYAKDLLKPGTKVPDFRLKTYDTRVVRLSDYRSHYVVLDFWASWCPDCRKDIPAMKELYSQYSTRGVDFIGISFDTDREVWAKTTYENGMNWIQVSELKKWKKGTFIDQLYNVKWIPTMYLIDPEGRIVLGTVEINKLKEALANLDVDKLVEKGPQAHFKGGQQAFDDFMISHLKGVIKDPKMNVRADLVVQFNVQYNGEINGAHVIEVDNVQASGTKFEKLPADKQQKFINEKLAEYKAEAIRFMNTNPDKGKETFWKDLKTSAKKHLKKKSAEDKNMAMPLWEPATVKGRPIQTNQLVTLNFGVIE